MSKKSKQVEKMVSLIEEDSNLTKDEKWLFKDLASIYFGEFKKNLYLSSLELTDKYSDVESDDWISFLKYRPVADYIKKFVDEDLELKAQRLIAKGEGKKSDGIRAQEMLDKRKGSKDNENIIVFLLPPKEGYEHL